MLQARINLSGVVRLLLLLCCLPIASWAQSGGSTTGSISGRVSDTESAVVSGVIVVARNHDTNLTRETTSNEDGSYQILQLTPGNYDITVSGDGFATQTINLEIVLGVNTQFNPVLRVGTTSEVVEVTAGNLVDDGRTESSTNVDRDRIEGLPINRRNFLDFSVTAPRVTQDRLPAQGASATSGLSFNGQTARANNITIDGFDNNDLASSSVRSTFSQDAVQEFQVVSDSYSAEFGRALGGVVNIVTKGGTNDFHGGLFFINRSDETSARDVFAPFEPDYKQYQFGASLSGPIKKEKAFFFTSFERLSIKQNNFVTIGDQTVKSANSLGFPLVSGPIAFGLGTTTALVRSDIKLTPNHLLYMRYNFGGTNNGALEPFGGLVAQSNSGVQLLDDNTFAVSDTYINPGLNLINEARFLYGRRNQDVLAVDPGPQVRVIAPEGQVTFGRGTFLPQFRQERIYQFVDNVSLTRFRQSIKFGVDFIYTALPDRKTNVPIFPGGLAFFQPINFSQTTGIPNLPSFTGLEALDPALRSPAQIAFLMLASQLFPAMVPGFPAGVPLASLPLPTAYIQGFGDTGLEVPQTLFSTFFQDDIKVRPNLLLKLGVRYDLNRVRFIPDNNGNISPRVGISYRPKNLEKMILHGSYGLFFAGAQVVGAALAVQNTTGNGALQLPVIPFPFAVFPFSQPGRHFPDSAALPPGVTVTPQLSQSFQYQKDLRNSYTQQFNIGADYLIGSNTVISASYDYVRGIKLFSPRNINPIVRPFDPNPVNNALFGRVDPTRGDVFEFESAFDSYYHAFTVSINRRFKNRFGFLAHYTFSKAIDNFLDVRTDLQEVVDPLNVRQERGLSLQDVRSRFVVSGLVDIGYGQNPLLTGYQLSTIVSLNTGRPYNLLAGSDLNMNGDNPPGDRPAGLGRNVGITPGFANVDLRLTRTVKFKEHYQVQGFVEMFNLFNRVNINEVDRIYPINAQGGFDLPPQDGSRYIAPKNRYRTAFSPRQFQFGLRVNF